MSGRLRPDSPHHLALISPDPLTLAKFYERVVGLNRQRINREASSQLVRSVWLSAGSLILMIERAKAKPPRRPTSLAPRRAGYHLLAWSIAVSERAAWQRHLKRQGISLVHETAYTLYFVDPEGNRVGLSHYPEPAPARRRKV